MVQISDDELLDELENCYDKHGKVTATLLNDPDNDYPTQPTYSSRFGSLGDALTKAGIEREKPGKKSKWDRDKIVETVSAWYNEEKTLNTAQLNKTDELPSSHAVYNHFDSLQEMYEACGILHSIKKNRREKRKRIKEKKYNEEDKDDLIHHLLWIQSEYDNTKTSTINSATGPSVQTYKKVFGSVEEARKEAGLNESYKENYTDRIGDLPNEYDDNADGYIYVLQMRKDAESYYYVGMSDSIENRLNSHSNGGTKITLHHENKRGTLRELDLVPISIVRVENMYRGDEENKEEFRERMKSKEHVVSYEVSCGLKTAKILGGVS